MLIQHHTTTLPRTLTVSLLIVGMISISFSAIFVKWVDAPVAISAMYRLLLTNLLMLPFLFRYLPEIRRIKLKDWWLLAASGFFLGLHFLMWMGSLLYTTVASSTVLLTLEPIFVLVGAFLIYNEKLSRGGFIGISLAMLGTLLISWGDFSLSSEALQGDALSILSALAVAVHMLLGQRLRSRISSFVYSFSVFASAAIVLAIYNLILGYSFIGYSKSDWQLFLLLAIVPTVFGHMLFNWLLRYMKASTISMSVLGEPVGASLLAALLLSEKVSPVQIGAAVLLLVGVWIFLRAEKTGNHESEESSNLESYRIEFKSS
jgi:drug/metabolite transporter (DMT)-like permease